MHGHTYSSTEALTMDYVDVVCNGKAANSSRISKLRVCCDFFLINLKDLFSFITGTMNQVEQKYRQPAASMNWLIYMLFARQEYTCCKDIIEQQLKDSFDKEYLYYIKVGKWGRFSVREITVEQYFFLAGTNRTARGRPTGFVIFPSTSYRIESDQLRELQRDWNNTARIGTLETVA